MSNYETSLKASLDNLSDEEISKKLKTGYFSDEARVVAEQVLSERGIASNEITENRAVGEISHEGLDYLTEEQNKKLVTGNVIVTMIALFLIGASQLNKLSDVPGVLFFQGLALAFVGTIIHLIYIQIKKKRWTVTELKKKYRTNFKWALFVIGLALFFTALRIFFNSTTVGTWIDLIVLGVILAMYLKSSKGAKNLLAIYSLLPPLSAIVLGSYGNTMVWALGFYVAAESLLIESVLISESRESV
jgi:hypothetical protein